MIPPDHLKPQHAEEARCASSSGWFFSSSSPSSGGKERGSSTSSSSSKFDSFTSSLSRRLRDSIPTAGAAMRQTLDGIADAIAVSASTLANEFNDMEQEAREVSERQDMEQFIAAYMAKHEQQSVEHFVESCNKALCKLPWEVWRNDSVDGSQNSEHSFTIGSIRGKFVEDPSLKLAVLALSKDEKTFTEPFLENDAMVIESSTSSVDDEDEVSGAITGASDRGRKAKDTKNASSYGYDNDYETQYCFYEQKKRMSEESFLAEHSKSIQRLLEIDAQLQEQCSALVGAAVSESIFWRNYFYHCERLRIKRESHQLASLTSEDDDDHRMIPSSPPSQTTSLGASSALLSSPTVASSNHSLDETDTIALSELDDVDPLEESDVVCVGHAEGMSRQHSLSDGSFVLICSDLDEDDDGFACRSGHWTL